MDMQFMHNNHSLSLNGINYNPDTNQVILYFSWNGVSYTIPAILVKTVIDDKNIIRAISSEEFSSFIMNFMNIENRSKKLNFLYEIIWNYAEKENKIQFPVRII